MSSRCSPPQRLASLAQSGKPLFGIQESNAGKVVIFAGGIPVRVSGNIIGAVGASAGTVEQDIAVAEAAVAALIASGRSSVGCLRGTRCNQLEGSKQEIQNWTVE